MSEDCSDPAPDHVYSQINRTREIMASGHSAVKLAYLTIMVWLTSLSWSGLPQELLLLLWLAVFVNQYLCKGIADSRLHIPMVDRGY